jgi:hypothetical protein
MIIIKKFIFNIKNIFQKKMMLLKQKGPLQQSNIYLAVVMMPTNNNFKNFEILSTMNYLVIGLFIGFFIIVIESQFLFLKKI